MDYNLESGAGLNVEQLLPHDHPMILVSGVKEFDKNLTKVISIVNINKDSLFFDPQIGGVPSYVSLEYMAQTIACLAGIYSLRMGIEPLKGFVLGTRKMILGIDRFVPGSYEVYCEEMFHDKEFASFDCKLYFEGQELASSLVNTYRVEDMQKFLDLLHQR